MPTFTLTDTKTETWTESAAFDGATLGVEGVQVEKRTLRAGPSAGVDVIRIQNRDIWLDVLPTRGMGIHRGAAHDIPLGWSSPVQGPVHPQLVDLGERGGLGWTSGFDEWIVRCGLDYNGAPGIDRVVDNQGRTTEVALTLHGKIANTPAHRVQIVSYPKEGRVEIVGWVREVSMLGPKLELETRLSLSADGASFVISDVAVNPSGTPQDLELLYHCNFGPPLLGAGARLLAPAKVVTARDARAATGIETHNSYEAPEPGFVEQVYFYELFGDEQSRSTVALVAPNGASAVALSFSLEELPCFTLWKNTAAESDGYVTGLEPATNYPNPKRVEREAGRVVRLEPGQRYASELAVELLVGEEQVGELEQRVQAMQHEPISLKPRPS